jgi:tellurite resistance protein TehA-like permease
MPFNLGWWGFTFPLGVYAVAILAVARATHIETLFFIGGALVVALAVLWISVSIRTLQGAWAGSLFHSPCLMYGSIPEDRIVGPS